MTFSFYSLHAFKLYIRVRRGGTNLLRFIFQTYLQLHNILYPNLSSLSKDGEFKHTKFFEEHGRSELCWAEGKTKNKVVKFLFSSCCLLPLQRVVSSVMLFDGLWRKVLLPAMLLYVFVMIAVCCQTHKNLNCSIKSPLTRGWKH